MLRIGNPSGLTNMLARSTLIPNVPKQSLGIIIIQKYERRHI